MRVMLIRPRDIGNINTRLPESLNKRQGVLPPLGISYIAGVLEKEGHEVAILDVIASNLDEDGIRRRVREFKPDVAGVTTMTPTFFGTLESARIAKEEGAVTVVGGPHLAIYPDETLSYRYQYIDYGISGEGEYAMLRLVDALDRKADPSGIEGLIYRTGDVVRANPPAIVDDLDSLPFPAYHLLPMMSYDSIIGLYPVSTMVTTRGCPYRCHFCFKQPSDRKFRARSPAGVVDEMEMLAGRYGVREIMFYDDVLTLRRANVVGICEEVLRRSLGVKWEAPARVDNVDGQLLQLMRRAGCVRLRYGIESGDERILDLMDKKIDLRLAGDVFRMTREAGIETFAYFMIGYAHEDESTVRRTIDFAIDLDPDLVMFTVVTPLPQTPLYDLAREEGLISDDYWREFTMGRKPGQRIPYFMRDADRWVRKAYREFYFRPGYFFRRLKGVRSWNSLIKIARAFRGIALFEMKGS